LVKTPAAISNIICIRIKDYNDEGRHHVYFVPNVLSVLMVTFIFK